jgi:hypothetical protein
MLSSEQKDEVSDPSLPQGKLATKPIVALQLANKKAAHTGGFQKYQQKNLSFLLSLRCKHSQHPPAFHLWHAFQYTCFGKAFCKF